MVTTATHAQLYLRCWRRKPGQLRTLIGAEPAGADMPPNAARSHALPPHLRLAVHFLHHRAASPSHQQRSRAARHSRLAYFAARLPPGDHADKFTPPVCLG